MNHVTIIRRDVACRTFFSQRRSRYLTYPRGGGLLHFHVYVSLAARAITGHVLSLRAFTGDASSISKRSRSPVVSSDLNRIWRGLAQSWGKTWCGKRERAKRRKAESRLGQSTVRRRVVRICEIVFLIGAYETSKTHTRARPRFSSLLAFTHASLARDVIRVISCAVKSPSSSPDTWALSRRCTLISVELTSYCNCNSTTLWQARQHGSIVQVDSTEGHNGLSLFVCRWVKSYYRIDMYVCTCRLREYR